MRRARKILIPRPRPIQLNGLAVSCLLNCGYAVGVGGGELVEGSFPALDGGGV